MPFHLYILQSETTNRFYIGQSVNLDERLAYHNANYSLSLKNRGPWKLVYTEEYATRSEAMRRERQIPRNSCEPGAKRFSLCSLSFFCPFPALTVSPGHT